LFFGTRHPGVAFRNQETSMRTQALALLAALLLAPSAQALEIQRSTTVTDAAGGTLSIQTSGDLHADTGSSVSELEADAFSPRGDGAISGNLTRSRERGGEEITTRYSGEVTLTGVNADGIPIEIVLALGDLEVIRDGDGPEFGGSVSIDGVSFDAGELPERARRLVRRVLRLFAFD